MFMMVLDLKQHNWIAEMSDYLLVPLVFLPHQKYRANNFIDFSLFSDLSNRLYQKMICDVPTTKYSNPLNITLQSSIWIKNEVQIRPIRVNMHKHMYHKLLNDL